MRTTLTLVLALAMGSLSMGEALAGPPAPQTPDPEKQFAQAAELLGELADHAPDWAWERASCASVLVIGKGGFLFGGTGGSGFLSCKDPETGVWSAPTALDVGGGSAGLQIGGQKAEVLMLFVGARDLEAVVHATPVFHTSASATAGPAGIGISGGGNPEIESEIITVSRSEGLYAGAIAEGLVINPDEENNAVIYGRAVTVRELLIDRSVAAPDAAKPLVEALAKEDAAAAD
jgi:SH3 domain-containing YSC84-like protein 1